MSRVNMPYYTCDMCGSTKDVKKVTITIDGARSTGDLCSAHRKPVVQVVNRFASKRGPVQNIPVVPFETFQRQAAQARGARRAALASQTHLSSVESETVADEVVSSSQDEGEAPESHARSKARR